MFVLLIIPRNSSRRNKEKYIYLSRRNSQYSLIFKNYFTCGSIVKLLATVKSKKLLQIVYFSGNNQLFILESCAFLLFSHISPNAQGEYIGCVLFCVCIYVCLMRSDPTHTESILPDNFAVSEGP